MPLNWNVPCIKVSPEVNTDPAWLNPATLGLNPATLGLDKQNIFYLLEYWLSNFPLKIHKGIFQTALHNDGNIQLWHEN